MTRITQSLLWASAIIAVALVSKANGLGDGESFAIISGLAGAAWASIASGTGCPRLLCRRPLA